MDEDWLGLVVSGKTVQCVHLRWDGTQNTLVSEFPLSLQSGDRPRAYAVLSESIHTYISVHGVTHAAIKASALAGRGTGLALLLSAEVRGVVTCAAAAAGAEVRLLKKASLSKTFGTRKVDEYIADDSYWRTIVQGAFAKTRREAALQILAAQR